MWCSQFQPRVDEKFYLDFKKKFLDEVKRTAKRCTKLCNRKYDQERNYSVSLHPEIERNRNFIARSTKFIHDEMFALEKISKTPGEKLSALIQYADGLLDTPFNNLFMTIFVGRISKRWITHAKESFQQHFNTHASSTDNSAFEMKGMLSTAKVDDDDDITPNLAPMFTEMRL